MASDPSKRQRQGSATLAVHAGEQQDTGAASPTTPPIHIATAWAYETSHELDAVFADNRQGYVYSRYGNPTVRGLETAVAALEGTDDAVAYASGMAAIHGAVRQAVRSGQAIVASRDVYGATYTLLHDHIAGDTIDAAFVDILDLDAVRAAVARTGAAAILAETISNPLLRVPDIPALAAIARDHGARLIIDNTFATPILVQPASLGADYVVHSTTKYLTGHGDSTGGIVATSAPEADAMRQALKITGAVLGPFEAWLTHRGLKTLPLRMREQCANAKVVMSWLQAHPHVSRVHYPGISNDLPGGVFLDGQNHGAMVGFELRNADQAAIYRFLDALEMVIPAPTMGDLASLALYPAMSSHRGLTPEQRQEIGIGDNLVRLSIGIENHGDIIEDLDQALGRTLAGMREG